MCWRRSSATSRTSTTGRPHGCRGRPCGACRHGRPRPSRAGVRKRRGPGMDAARDLFDLTGRHALVTGASRGIGLAIARALGRRGASIAITGRKEETLRAAAEGLRGEGVAAHPVVCHQGDLAAIEGLFEQLDRDGHTPDIVVINAATNPVYGPLL